MTVDELRELWRDKKEVWERLHWARTFWQVRTTGGIGTMKDAALSLDMKPNTYSQYERSSNSSRHAPLNHVLAKQLGRKFKVNWEWLLTGDGSPFDQSIHEAQERVISAMQKMSDEQKIALAEMVEAMTKIAAADEKECRKVINLRKNSAR